MVPPPSHSRSQDMPEDPMLARFVKALRSVPGLAALVLGGSRGRGAAGPTSDHDLGLYYEPEAPLDIEALRSAVAPLADDPAFTLTPLGAWGPWINGGAWLASEGAKIDLLYRDLGQVRGVISQARQGQFTMSCQPGHPHGFCSTIWMGEVATCRPPLDPAGVVEAQQGRLCENSRVTGFRRAASELHDLAIFLGETLRPAVEQVEHGFRWPGELHAVGRDHDRPVHQNRVLDHCIEDLIVGLARVEQAEFGGRGAFLAQNVTRSRFHRCEQPLELRSRPS